jgi:hypothetical protein
VQEHYLEDLPSLLQGEEARRHRSSTDAKADANCLLILEQELAHVKTEIENMQDQVYHEASEVSIAGDEVEAGGRAASRLAKLQRLAQKLQVDFDDASRR